MIPSLEQPTACVAYQEDENSDYGALMEKWGCDTKDGDSEERMVKWN